MSWHFSLALVEAYSAARCSDGAPSVPLNSTHTAALCSCSDRTTDTYRPSRSGTTSAPSTADPGADLLTWYLEVSHVKTLAAPENAPESTGNAQDSGERWPESSARSNHGVRSLRIRRTFVLAGLDEFSKTWPAWGMMRGGECSELTPLALPTAGGVCGSWPTPTTIGNELSPAMMKWPCHRRLVEVMANGCLPTPTASLYGANQGGAAGRIGPVRPSLEGLTGGPWISFREWMMGWPIGWTAFGPLATDKFQQWSDWHGKRCSGGK